MKKLDNEGRKEKGESIHPSLIAINLLFPGGVTIDAQIAAMEIRIKRGVSSKEIFALNESIWTEYEKGVTPEDFAMAVEKIRKLKELVESEGIVGETLANILLTESRLVYYRDKKSGSQSDEACQIAMTGLQHAQEPGTKVSLYNVASDTMGELVGDYKRSVELADSSCVIAKTGSDVDLGKAENNAALRYLNLAKRFVDFGENEKAKTAFNNAIAHFEKALDAHQKAGNKRQSGHAHNNMILCYQGLANLVKDFHRIEMCDRAISQAQLAQKAYGDHPKNALHAISANYRKGKTYELRAELTESSVYLLRAIQCYAENAMKAIELEKWEKVKQELDNIQKIVQK